MLAESLEAMRERVLDRLASATGFGSGSADGPEGASRSILPALLDDLGASLRRGVVGPAEPALTRPVPPPHCPRPSWLSGFDADAVVREYRLLGDCIHDLIESGVVEASPREMRVLSDWLTVRASARALQQAEEAIEANRMLAALLDAIPDPIAAMRRDGTPLFANHAALEVAHSAGGLAFHEMARRNWADLAQASELGPDGSSNPPPAIRECDEHMSKAIAGATVATEVVFPTPRGARWFEHTLTPIRDGEGTPASVAAVSRDIHDRKRSQASLSLLSKIAALAGTLDYEQVLTAVARLSIPEFADWCVVDVVDERGARRAEVAHRDPAKAALVEAFRRFPLDHPARRRMPAAGAVRSGRPVLIPFFSEKMLQELTSDEEFLDVARQLGPCSEIVIPVTLASSVATMSFFVTAESGRRYGPEDVAVAEELVKRAAQLVETARVHQKLGQTEARFRVALEHSPITLFEQDAEARYRWIYNPPLGYRADDVLGKTNDELFRPVEATRVNDLDRAVLREGERVQAEVPITPPRGETLHLLVSKEPLRDGAGAIVGLTGAATDITQQKKAQETLSQAVAFREQMMGILGHDLRNPLSAVRALATLLLGREELHGGVRESLLEIDRAGKRMLEMIATLLDFTESRFTGRLPIAPVAMDLHDTCRGVVEELLAAEPDRAIELDLDGDGRGTWDPARLAQVVSNLGANALKHGARHGTVRVSVTGDEEDVVLKVTNQGPAIAPALMAVLFEPFCRGSAFREATHVRGLGLGLFIARQIVVAHGGTITVDSTGAQGTTFTVRLPRADGVAHPEAHRAGPAGAEAWQADA